MDSFKTLMDRKDYDLVIKLTEGSQDINHLFYRVTAFLAVGKGEEALSVIKNNRKILENDLPVLMKIHIEILCVLGKFDEAYDEVKYYENLPYVNQETEELLRDLPKFIRNEEKNAIASRDISNEKLKERLKSQDQNVVLPALDLIRDRDINMFLNEIQGVLLKFPKQSIRSFALLLLVQKKVDKEVSFNHLGNIIKVNPSEIDPPFVGSEFNEFIKAMNNEIKDPAVSQDAVQILSSYIIYMYPEQLNLNYSLLIEALRTISEEYLRVENQIPLSERCLNKGINLEEAEQLIQRIKDCLDDF